MGKITKNTLFYGDNLDILRNYIDDESIDLIYLDPPFNSNRSYNVLFQDESGIDSEAQITAFDDSWHWGDSAEETYFELINNSSSEIATMISALRQFIGTNQMMAYLVMMTIRLIELHRVLRDTGCLYLHCDPTASHYLKIILDTIFGGENFRNEIVWHYRRWTGDAKKFLTMHDILLYYAKDKDKVTFNVQYTPYTEKSLKRKQHYHTRIKGNDVYVTNINEKGVKENDVWIIQLLNSQSKERLGYPTQKPIELLDKIINTSSNKGDWILDPFSGCGTAISSAQKFNRNWIGIDITQLAIALHKNRLKDMFNLEPKIDYKIIGEPESLHDAVILSQQNRHQFQIWASSLIDARIKGNRKKGKDRGIDGLIIFSDDSSSKAKQVLVQVKSGHVNSGFIRDFRGAIERESNAVMGVFITLEKPTSDMQIEALEAGYYVSPINSLKYKKIQIMTIEELLNGKKPDLPQTANYSTFKKADKVKKDNNDIQGTLDI